MLVTFVVRLASRQLAEGSIVGHVVDVTSGEHIAIHDAGDLVSFLRRHADDGAGPLPNREGELL